MSDAPRDTRDQDEAGASTGPTVTDRRRIDPQTGQVREPQQAAAPAAGATEAGADAAPAEEAAAGPVLEGDDPRLGELQSALDERTLDLQRLQAEYVNYKRRVDRDRDLTRQLGTEAVLRDLLDVLDGVATARTHGELTGGFKGLADGLEKVASRYGLTAFGEKGDPFDPNIHEALMQAQADDITVPTCVEILQAGYRVGEKVLRPARVAVAEPSAAS